MEFDELLEQGEALAGEGLVLEALERFEQALDMVPDNPELMEAAGRALLKLDRLDEAEANFLDVLKLEPDWPDPHMGLALVAMQRNEAFKAIHHLERAIETDPDNPEAYVELGRYYGLIGELELARATYDRWTQRHPEDPDMLINAGSTAFDAGDYEMSLEFFDSALETATESGQIYGARTFRANSLDMLGRYQAAVEEYEQVIAESPEWWEAHVNLGICHTRNGQAAAAGAAFRRGLKACPGSPEIRDELAAHLLNQNGDLDEALRLAEEAVALGRDEIRHLHTLGEVRMARKDDVGAIQAYRSVLDLDPEDPNAHLELGLIYERQDLSEEAEAHFLEAIKYDPANPRILYSYAGLFYASGDLETAEALLERAVAADEEYSLALSALASIRARRGEYEDALEYLERAVDAGESDMEHFRNTLEFIPLRSDPKFQTLLARMKGMEDNNRE